MADKEKVNKSENIMADKEKVNKSEFLKERQGIFGFGFSNNNNLDLLNLFVLAFAGIIIKVFFKNLILNWEILVQLPLQYGVMV